MTIVTTLKGPVAGLLLAVAYSSMVLDIIQIKKVHEDQNTQTYPPAVIAMLVAAILQFLYHLIYFIRGGKGVLFKAAHVAGAIVFFFCFQVVGKGAVAATTALRHKNRYCPPSASNYGDCNGCIRGTMGLGWALVGLDLIYLGFIASLVSSYGKWSDEVGHLPPRVNPNAELDEKAGH